MAKFSIRLRVGLKGCSKEGHLTFSREPEELKVGMLEIESLYIYEKIPRNTGVMKV